MIVLIFSHRKLVQVISTKEGPEMLRQVRNLTHVCSLLSNPTLCLNTLREQSVANPVQVSAVAQTQYRVKHCYLFVRNV